MSDVEFRGLPRTSEKLRKGEKIRIVSFGDSISEVGRTPNYFGGASCPEKNWASVVRDLLANAYPNSEIEIIYCGIGGQNSYEGLGRRDVLEPLNADLVIVAFGANDCGWHHLEPWQTTIALQSISEGIRVCFGADVAIACTGGDNPLKSSFEHLDETIAATRQIAVNEGVPFIDIRSAILQKTNDGLNWGEYHYSDDNCHPNDRGHQVWGEAVFAALKLYLQKEVVK
jgi:lysophospholipase L1-like esterase